MTSDRRSDVGQKIMIGLILGGFGTIVGFFINTLSISAMEGVQIGQQNSVKIAYLESNISTIKDDLTEIKGLLKRGVVTK